MNEKDYIKCPLCPEDSVRTFHKNGMSNHFLAVHKQSWLKFQNKTIKYEKKCKNCNNVFSKKNHRFCSKECKKIYLTNNVILTFENMSEEIKKKIIDMYKTNFFSMKDISKAFGVSNTIIKKVFKEKKIEIRTKEIKKNKIEIKKQETLKSLVESDLAKQIFKEYQENPNISITYLERKYYKSKHLSSEHIVKILQYYGVEGTLNQKTEKKCYSKFNKATMFCHWFFYEGVYYQGSYEFKYALFLKFHKIKFLYRKYIKPFQYIDCNGEKKDYHPDFYLIDTDEYIETKGIFTNEDKQKIQIIIKTYPNIKLSVYRKDKLKELGVLEIEKKINIDIFDYQYLNENMLSFYKEIKQKNTKDLLIKKIIYEKKSILRISKELDIPLVFVSKLLKEYGLFREHNCDNEIVKKEKFKFLLKTRGIDFCFDYTYKFETFEFVCKKYGRPQSLQLVNFFKIPIRQCYVQRKIQKVQKITFEKQNFQKMIDDFVEEEALCH